MDGSGPLIQCVVQNRDDGKVMPAGQKNNGGIMMDKTSLRKEAKTRLQAMESDHREKDASICRRVVELMEATEASALAAYAAMKSEPMLESLMSAWLCSGKPLYLPRFNQSSREYEMVAVHDLSADLVMGHYGILEPRSELAGLRPPYDGDRRMMWLIPGLGFDMKGHRLGRGGGYYDRLLCGATGMKTGIGYDCQIFDTIPCEPHDIGVDYVVTETRIVECGWHLCPEGLRKRFHD